MYYVQDCFSYVKESNFLIVFAVCTEPKQSYFHKTEDTEHCWGNLQTSGGWEEGTQTSEKLLVFKTET